MTDIITMSDGLYRLAQVQFNPQFINTIASGSSFNPFAQVVGPTSVYWMANLTFIEMNEDMGLLELRRFIMKLQGGKVLARLYDKSRTSMSGTGDPGGGTINVAADAAAGATSITVKNLTPSQTVALGAFDMMGIGENLYAVEDPVGSDGSGNATVNFQPPLRQGIAANDPINIANPTGLFRLVSGGTDLTIAPPVISQNVALAFVEEPDVS